MKAWPLILLAVTQLAAAPAPAGPETPVDDRVPLVALIANPAAYDGRYVETFGYLNLEYEGDALYLGKADHEAFATQNGIWFDGPKLPGEPARRALDRHYVHASGIFHADDHGHMGVWRGALRVDHVEVAPSRRQLSYLYDLPLSPISLPWPPILGLLIVATALIYGGHLIGRINAGRKPVSDPRPAPRRQPAPWTVLVLAVSLFIALRVIGNAQIVWMAMRVSGFFDIWFVFSLAECLAGGGGLAVMWFAHRTRRRTLCALAILLQLAAPGARELMRMDTWQSQMTYPSHPRVVAESWSRPVAPQQPR